MVEEIAIGHLQKRKIETRVLIPVITARREKFGDGPTSEVVAATVRALAADEGAKWAESLGRDVPGLRVLAEKAWAGGGSLDITVLDQAEDRLDFHKELGLADIGALVRSQTIMEGGSCCDFRFRRKQ